jgi:hypothetical protein
MRGERSPERLLLACAPPRCEKGPGFIESTADIEPQWPDDETKKEWYAPTPAVERLGRENARDKRA